ncbi:hypothetical protein [Lelliottia jeotgali]
MSTEKTTTIAEAVRNLIVCDTQFGWTGETTLKLPELVDLQAHRWLIERLLVVAVLGCYSSTHGIDHFLSFGGKSEQLRDGSPRICRPRLPHGWRVPKHLEHRVIFRRSDSSRLTRYIPRDGHGSREALGRGRIKRHSQSTDSLQFCLQRLNQRQKVVPVTSFWRVAILIQSVTNSTEVALRPVQARPEGDHRELVGRNLLRLSLLALTPRQVKGNQSCSQRSAGAKPSSDCRYCRPVRMASMSEGEAWNNHVGQVHRPPSSLSCTDFAIPVKERRRTA